MNYMRFLSAIMGMLILTCWATERNVFAQSGKVIAGDGIPTTVPENIDAVLFSPRPKEPTFKLTLRQVEAQWEQICGYCVISQMGPVRHERVLDFLYRVAVFDPSLNKKKPYTYLPDGEWALHNMLRMAHPALPEKLALILRAPFTGIPAEEVRKIKGKAAQELLRYKGVDKKLIFAVLDKNAQEGDVLCPYPYPKGGFGKPGSNAWVDPPIEPEARELLRKWMALENRTVRMEAASCAARAGIPDVRVRELAEAEVGEGQTLPRNRSHERVLAEDTLKVLRAHGDLKAAEKYERIQMEHNIKDCSPLGVPAEDKICRERYEKEFKEKWKK